MDVRTQGNGWSGSARTRKKKKVCGFALWAHKKRVGVDAREQEIRMCGFALRAKKVKAWDEAREQRKVERVGFRAGGTQRKRVGLQPENKRKKERVWVCAWARKEIDGVHAREKEKNRFGFALGTHRERRGVKAREHGKKRRKGGGSRRRHTKKACWVAARVQEKRITVGCSRRVHIKKGAELKSENKRKDG